MTCTYSLNESNCIIYVSCSCIASGFHILTHVFLADFSLVMCYTRQAFHPDWTEAFAKRIGKNTDEVLGLCTGIKIEP